MTIAHLPRGLIMAIPTMLNNDLWQRHCFIVDDSKLPSLDRDNRYTSTARLKFSDTTLGGNRAMNPPPQFCRYADIKVSGILAGRPAAVDTPIYTNGVGIRDADGNGRSPVGSRGLGRYYNKAFEETGEYLTMRFGVAKNNPLLNFFNRFYDAEAAAVARTGKGTSIFFEGSRILGTIMGYALAPQIMVAKAALFFFTNVRVSKYYYLDHKMHLYWQAVNNMANTLAVNRNIIPRLGGRGETRAEMEARLEEIRQYHAALPDIFRSDGGIDVMAVSTRYSRLSIRYQARVNKIAAASLDLPDFLSRIAQWTAAASATMTGGIYDTKAMSIEEYIDMYLDDEANRLRDSDQDNEVNAFPTTEGDEAGSATYGFTEKATEMAKAIFNDGNQFVTFRLANSGPSTESFSNSAGESSAQSKYNGLVSSARSIRFNAGEFQTGVGLVDSMAGAVKDMVGGIFSSVGVEGLAAFMGNAFVDMPQVWQQASAQLPRPQFTIELRSWSGSPMAQYQRIWIQVCMWLAAALPLSAGPAAYTAPLLLEAYSDNRCSIKLGMVDSLTITRGVGNLGRNREQDPLGVTIQVGILDLSTIAAIPITTQSGTLNGFGQTIGSGVDAAINGVGEMITGEPWNVRGGQAVGAAVGNMSVFDDSSPLNDLMAVYGGLGLTEQIYALQKYRLNLTRQMSDFNSWMSISSTMNQISGTFPGRVLSAITRGVHIE